MGRATNGKNETARPSCLRPQKPTLKLSTASNSPGHQVGANKGNLESRKPTSDRSQLNFPYDVRLNGYSSIHSAVTKGTPRIRRLLMDECDYIMECRICRNLFRSLPNFITHKSNYCKKLFDSTWSIGLSNLIQTSETSYNIEYEVDPALLLDDNCSTNPNNTRSVSDLYNEIAMKAHKCNSSKQSQSPTPSTNENVIQLQLKPLVDTPGGTVVLQQRETSDPSNCDINSVHMNPVLTARHDTAILGPDGKVVCAGSSKGIEHIVSKLTARLQEMGEKQAQIKNATSFTCDICKTVFDSEKSLRQHKRESLDCGRTWGCRFPANESTVTTKTAAKDTMSESSQENPLKSSNNFVSQTSTRRQSFKRRFSLSPVKRIKMKYNKLDCNGTIGEGKVERKLSCSRCSSSFTTKHEMSMHLALCNGVINYAILQDYESPKEKIRISARNDFKKPKAAKSLFKDVETNEVTSSPNKIRKLRMSSSSPEITDFPFATMKNKRRARKKSEISPTASASAEVNNNKQYKNENPQSSTTASDLNVVIKNSPSKLDLEPSAAVPIINGIVHEDMDVKDDSNCFSVSVPPSVQESTECDLTNLSSVVSKSVMPLPSTKAKKANVADVGPASTRLDRRAHISGKTFNLRRAISSRVHTNRRRHQNLDQQTSRIKLRGRKTRHLTRSCTTISSRKHGKPLANGAIREK